jgi:hypothetical protein
MADVRCPMCGKPNPDDQDVCQFCGARLKPLLASSPDNVPPIKVGEGPVGQGTPESEKTQAASNETIQLGEAPTKKNTAELERALPSWLRTLREGEDNPAQETAPEQDMQLGSIPANPGPSGEAADWLSGLDKAAAADEEQVPDWLTGLRSADTSNSAPDNALASEAGLDAVGSLSTGPGDADWMARLSNEPQPQETKSLPGFEGETGSFPRLESQESEPVISAESEQASAPQDQESPEWLSGKSTSGEEIPASPNQTEDLPDWLSQLKEKAIDSKATPQENEETSVQPDAPDWISNFRSASQPTKSAPGEALPDWLSNLEAKTGPESTESTPPTAIFDNNLPPSGTTGAETPDWLSRFQSGVNAAEEQEAQKEQFEQAPPEPLKKKETEPLPAWLAGVKPSSMPSEGTPALIESDEPAAEVKKEDTAFSLEAPDWLSKLKPEMDEENNQAADEDASGLERLDVAELPSWVQAMRPVESVVSEARATSQEDAAVTERSGPLAGLQGVLPASPGLGTLRKPPAYSTILQVTDGQQRYAAALERLISSETQPKVAKTTRITSNRLWRWLIAVLLILAVGFPLFTGIPITPPSSLRPPEMVAAYNQIDSLSSGIGNPPVLVVFDYEPAFSGELEAAAAPLLDYLILNKAPRLALISTSPTGSALAERFFTDKKASPLIAGHGYQAGQQYVNLGYLAGGPAGVLFFAMSPTQAAPLTVDGQPAWQSNSPLQGIQKLSDFAAIIILTDNADSGRVWIEQTSSTIGATPMLMVISAQAEPLILPYFDSKQIKGVVTGLAGGEASERTYTRPDAQTGLAQRYWSSFGGGTFVAIILITVGAVWNALSAWRKRRAKSGEGV